MSGLLCISLNLLTIPEPLELKSVPVDQAGNIELGGGGGVCEAGSILSFTSVPPLSPSDSFRAPVDGGEGEFNTSASRELQVEGIEMTCGTPHS